MLTVANLITLFRIGLVPVFVLCFMYAPSDPRMSWIALSIFTVAAALDAVDGLVARAFNQKTSLGAFLDPLADKLLMTIVYILGVGHGIPLYVTVLVLSRDFLIVLGWAALRVFERDTEISPIWISKVNTACQFVTAILFLLNMALTPTGGLPSSIVNSALGITIFTTIVSGGACFVDWYRRMGGFSRG